MPPPNSALVQIDCYMLHGCTSEAIIAQKHFAFFSNFTLWEQHFGH